MAWRPERGGCASDGPNRAQTEEKKEGFLQSTLDRLVDGACSADRQLDRESTTKSDEN